MIGRRRWGIAFLGVAACAARGGTPSSATPVFATAVPARPAASPPSNVASAEIAPSFEAEARQLLDEMVAVDTSHGKETTLLEPIAARYRRAGVPVQILESSPGRGNLIARLRGSGAKTPLLLIAHVDVVPVEGQPWTVPPFAATERDGYLWGRGVNDDKGMAAAIVAVTLDLARSGAELRRDVIVALTAGEETGGAAGARWLVEQHRDLIDASLALNEGGSPLLTDDASKVLAVHLGVSEKLFQTYKLVVHGKGGHSSQPPTSGDPVVVLARALLKVGELRFAARVTPEAKARFESEIPSAEKAYVPALRHAVASAPRIAPADDAVLAKDPQYNAQIRTTCVTTMLQGSPQDNVLPTTAEATVNCRILPGDTRAQVRGALTSAIDNPAVELVDGPSNGGETAGSPFDGEIVDAVRKAAEQTLAGAPVIPAMSAGATDSRFLRAVGIRAYGVGPGSATRAEALSGHLAHGPDERRPLRWVGTMAAYFREIVRTLVL